MNSFTNYQGDTQVELASGTNRTINDLWEASLPIYHRIVEHPFIQSLKEGYLDEQVFRAYIVQDAIYLSTFSRCLALLSGRLVKTEWVLDFLEFAKHALIAERSLHEEYLASLKHELVNEASPACFMYVNYLLATVSAETVEEALAALLPCFWIYREVGVYIYQNSRPNNPYQWWIDNYSGEEFNQDVQKILTIANDILREVPSHVYEKMKKAFLFSCKLEYLFWDSAYHQEKWMI